MAIEAHCGTLSALTLALPRSCAVPESRGTLPKGMFVAKVAVSAKTKQHLIHAIDGITMLAILRAANTGVEQGRRIPEVLVIGLRLADGIEEAPHDIVELIQAQRKSGIVFVCVRNVEFEGAMREEACFVVRRPLSERISPISTRVSYARAESPNCARRSPNWRATMPGRRRRSGATRRMPSCARPAPSSSPSNSCSRVVPIQRRNEATKSPRRSNPTSRSLIDAA